MLSNSHCRPPILVVTDRIKHRTMIACDEEERGRGKKVATPLE